MRNKWFAILFSVIFLVMMLGAPTNLLLTKLGVLPRENVGNQIKPEKTYEEGSFLFGPLTAIENAKVAIKDTYINYLPGFLGITNTFKPLKADINRPVTDWLAALGRDDIVRQPQSCRHVYDDSVVPPTCTEAGYTLRTCRLCGESETDEPIAAVGHTYTQAGTKVAAGCDSYGYTKNTCDTCHAVTAEALTPPLGHEYTLITRVEADCHTEGKKHYKCDYCDATYDVILPEAHSYTVTRIAAGGVEMSLYDCVRCDKEFIASLEEIDGHIHRDIVTEVAATCDAPGYTAKLCEVCGEERREGYVPPTGHAYRAEIVAPGCLSIGYTRLVCEHCGGEEICDRVNARGHDYAVTTVAPTVYAEGYDLKVCRVCDHAVKTNYTPKVILGLPLPTTVQDPEGTVYHATLKTPGVGFRTYLLTATYPDGTKDSTFVRVIAMDRTLLYDKMVETVDMIEAMVEKDESVNWYFSFTGNLECYPLAEEFFPEQEISDIYEEFLLRLPSSVKTADIEINSFKDYADKYYITDHHWNHNGVMEAYYRIVAMLRENYPDVEPMPLDDLYYYEEVDFYGSFARLAADYGYSDDFGVYFFDLPEHTLTRDTAIDYGAKITLRESLALYENGAFSREKPYNHYTDFYRVPKKIVYEGNHTGRRLLLIGDSYSLPLIELVAAHFDVTFVRYEDRAWDNLPADLYYDEFIAENGITDVIVLEEFVKVIQGYGTSYPSGFISIYPERAWKKED